MVNKDSPIACSMRGNNPRTVSRMKMFSSFTILPKSEYVVERSGMCRRCEMHFEIRNDLPCVALTATRLHNASMRSSRLTAVYQRSQ